MHVLLIRHGESTNNVLLAQGVDDYFADRVADPPLTERGVEQAELLADWLGHGHVRIDDLYCSPMLRAVQTVAPTAEALDLRPKVWPEIHEDGGMYLGDPRSGDELTNVGGLTRDEFARDHPRIDLVDAVTDQGWSTAGFETRAGCDGRALAVCADLFAWTEEDEDDERTVGLVSHGQFCDSLIKACFGALPDRRTFYALHNTALTLLHLRPRGRVLLAFHNRVEHLPDDLRTY